MENKRYNSFEELEVWKISRELVLSIYGNFFNCRDFSFKDQITRASISILNNIAEGHERDSNKEFARFLKISKGSCGEVRSMLIIAKDLNYIDVDTSEILIQKCYSISRQLAGFIKYLNSKIL